MFWSKRKKQVNVTPYDAGKQIPVIRASICTGEQVAGFQNKENRKFEEASWFAVRQICENFVPAIGSGRKILKRCGKTVHNGSAELGVGKTYGNQTCRAKRL